MSPQQFSLRWNNHTKNLVQVFADQFEREQHVDVTISCQGRFLKAHKIVLGACSPYFQDLFDSHESTQHPIIIMNGYSFDDIRSIVEFMYRGEVMVAETAMQRLLAAAEDLQIKGLSNVRSKRDGGGGTGHGQHHDAADEQEEEDDGDGGGGGINLQQQQQQQHQMGVQDCSNKSSASGGSPNSAKDFGNQSQQASNNENGSGGGKGPGLYKRRKRARAGSPVNNQTKRKLRTSGSQQKQGSLSPRDNDSTVADDLRMNVDDSKAEPLIKDPSELMMMINVDPHHQQQDDDDDKQSGSGGGNNKDGTGSTSGDERNNSEGGGNNNGGSGNGKSGGNNIVSVGMIPLESLVEPKEKIPRPPNSFMIFANEWRRQLAGQFPNESNKEISVRLGVMWKNLTDDVKAKYFNAARRANDDHKKKYPDYHYNPKEARMRKMFKLQQQSMGHHLVTTASHH